MQGYNFIVLSAMSNADSIPLAGDTPRTPLSTALQLEAKDLRVFCGMQTSATFDGAGPEIDALLGSAGVFDLGWRGKIAVTGGDRLRWLNGMVTNTVQGLAENEGNYSFLLNTQGRIQGDCYVYRRADDLILDTSRDQVPALLRQLDHYIIMDEVELADVSKEWTSLGLAGPKAPQLIASLGFSRRSGTSEGEYAHLSPARIGEIDLWWTEERRILVPRYELWFHPSHVLAIWRSFQEAGAFPAGLEAAESLRVAEGTPLYGVDLNDRDLPQETSQGRALNFTKGCYLGQEIVERIRSRGKVHRRFRQFVLDGTVPQLPFELRSQNQAIGSITSAASLSSVYLSGNFALGFAREGSPDREAALEYDGGTAVALEAPPQIFMG
jgi:folate-binding protein YgfZ